MDQAAVDRLIARAQHDGDFVPSYYDRLRLLLSSEGALEPLARLVAFDLLSFLELPERKQRRLARQLVGARRSRSLAERRADALAGLERLLEQRAGLRPQWAPLAEWAKEHLPDWSLRRSRHADDVILITGLMLADAGWAASDAVLASLLYAEAQTLAEQATGRRPAPRVACVPEALGFFAGNYDGCYFDELGLVVLCKEPTLALLLHELIHATQPHNPEGRTMLDHWLMEGATEGLTRLHLPAGESSHSYPELVDFATALARILKRDLKAWLRELSGMLDRDLHLARLLGLETAERAPDELLLAIHPAYYHHDLRELATGGEARVDRLVALLTDSLTAAGLRVPG